MGLNESQTIGEREYQKFTEDNSGDIAVRVVAEDSLPVTGGGSGGGNNTYSNMQGDFTATANSGAKTITFTGLPYTLTAESIATGSIKKIDSSGVVTSVPLTSVAVSNNVVTLADLSDNFSSGDTVALTLLGPDKTYDSGNDLTKTQDQSPLWTRYTDFVTLVTAQDLTGSYADFGGQIDSRGYNTLGIVVTRDVNDSINVDLKVLAEMVSGGTVDIEIDGIATKSLWGASGADGSTYYEFEVGTIPFIQLQAIAGTVGATAGDLTIDYNLFYK